jgi:hypothetical protein
MNALVKAIGAAVVAGAVTVTAVAPVAAAPYNRTYNSWGVEQVRSTHNYRNSRPYYRGYYNRGYYGYSRPYYNYPPAYYGYYPGYYPYYYDPGAAVAAGIIGGVFGAIAGGVYHHHRR